MSLRECFEPASDAGFDGVEVNDNMEGELSAESSKADLKSIDRLAESSARTKSLRQY